MMSENKFLHSALLCVGQGWAVFALGEKSKTPDSALSPNGFKSASKDPEQIKKWWAASPNANVGIALGDSNLTVLDFDNGEIPPELLARLPETLMVRTSRGVHVYLAGASKTGKLVFNGQALGDIKSIGGYVLAPFCQHPDGPVYAVAKSAPVAPAPNGLVDSLRGERQPSPTIEGEKIPRGEHDIRLTSIGGKLREIGLEKDAIYSALVEVCEKRCVDYGPDYREMCDKIAKSVSKYPIGKDYSLVMSTTQNATKQQPDLSNWRSMFRSVGEMEQGEIVMIINGVLQEGICFIGANPGDGKTLVALAFAKAIATGTPLFGLSQFSVKEARTCIYLIPESGDRAFRKRCEAFRMPDDKSKFMARTISSGLPLELGDPGLLEAVRQTKAVVFLDTASRFMKGKDENASAQNRELVNDVIALLSAGAVCIVLIHHATKAAKAKREVMTLENMLRGSSDLGAMADQAFGIRKDMGLYANGTGPMEIDLVNLKDREQVGVLTSLRLAASTKHEGADFPTSCINGEGNFKVVNNAETHKRTLGVLVSLVKVDPNLPEQDLADKTGLSTYAVKRNLNAQGWHRIKGGLTGASPWHQDFGGQCPFEIVKVSKSKPSIAEAVAFLREELSGTEPGGTYTGVAESDVLTGADERGFSDALVTKAKKRLNVLVNKDTKEWSLPGEQTEKEPEMAATNR